MKLNFLSFLVLSVSLYAQTGKVGVNTDVPTRVLDISGDVRIRTLEEAPTTVSVLVPDNGVDSSESNVIKKRTFQNKVIFQGKLPKKAFPYTAKSIIDESKETTFVNNVNNRLEFTEVLDTENGYMEGIGAYKIQQPGIYNVSGAVIVERTSGPESSFTGRHGYFRTYIEKVDEKGSKLEILAGSGESVFLGSSLKGVPLNAFYVNTTMYFEKGDIVRVSYTTYGVDDMHDSSNPKSFWLDPQRSNFVIKRIL